VKVAEVKEVCNRKRSFSRFTFIVIGRGGFRGEGGEGRGRGRGEGRGRGDGKLKMC
jgi:hypothetical protein